MRYLIAGAGASGVVGMVLSVAQHNDAGINIGAMMVGLTLGWFVREAEVRR